jgi:hypothetical protein
MNKTILSIILSLVVFSTTAFAECGPAQPIYGRAMDVNNRPISGVFVSLINDFIVTIQVRRTNQFGWYQFDPVSPCTLFLVDADHRRHSFEPPLQIVRPTDFNGKGVRVDFTEADGDGPHCLLCQ